jgi:hypothetical protein
MRATKKTTTTTKKAAARTVATKTDWAIKHPVQANVTFEKATKRAIGLLAKRTGKTHSMWVNKFVAQGLAAHARTTR